MRPFAFGVALLLWLGASIISAPELRKYTSRMRRAICRHQVMKGVSQMINSPP
jgi:hypothetical protein